MQRFAMITDDIHDALNGFNKVNVGDEVRRLWRYRELTLSASDIVHLLHGGCLYTSDGEYATVIALERGALIPQDNEEVKE